MRKEELNSTEGFPWPEGIVDAQGEHLDQLVEMYLEAYTTGEWEDEEHEPGSVRKKFTEWIESPTHWVKVMMIDGKVTSFIIYRTVPLSEFSENLANEMEEVSGVRVSPEKREEVQDIIDGFIEEDLKQLSDSQTNYRSAGIVQDIVSVDQEQSSSLHLIVAALDRLINELQVDILAMYTKEEVSTKSIAQRLGGTIIIQEGSHVAHAAPSSVVQEKMRRYLRFLNNN